MFFLGKGCLRLVGITRRSNTGKNCMKNTKCTPEQLEQLASARRFITKESYAKAKAKRDRPIIERMEKFRVVNGDDECWGWTGSTDSRGYGKLTVNCRLRIATHLALEMDGRPRPSPNHCACHTCDNPTCTNPAHLWWGTRAENSQDMVRKGRQAGGIKGRAQ